MYAAPFERISTGGAWRDDTLTDLLKFPCDFVIKVMGRAGSDFEGAVIAILRRHFPNLPEGAISTRASRDGNYSALNIVVPATSREQLDALYRDLTACEHVVMAL